MANSTPWSERSGAQRRRTFGGFTAVYGVVAIGALAVGWIPVGVIFGIGALALGIAWMSTSTESAPAASLREREKPDWMRAMDDPDAPDLSRPEYRTEPRTVTDEAQRSPFDRPDQAPQGPAGSRPDQPPPVPPTPGV